MSPLSGFNGARYSELIVDSETLPSDIAVTD